MRLLKFLIPALALSLSMLAGPASAQQFKMLSSWDQNYAYNPYLIDPFIEGLREATDGRIDISVFGPETVPPFEQLEPVGAGVFDFLFTHGAYHFGTSPLMLVADALVGDINTVREAGVFDVLDKHYQQFGLKLVMLPITPPGAYHIISRRPVTDDGDLSGMKVRGTLSYEGVVNMLNASLVVIPASEIYSGLEKGVVDGAAWPIIGALEYRWYEVADYLLRPGFGANYEPIFMNLDAWNNLSEEDQRIMMEISQKVEDSWYVDAVGIWEEEEKALLEKGMIITEMGDEQKAKLQEAWAEGLWKLGRDANPKATEELYEFAKSKGLTQ